MLWYYARNGQRNGPVEEAELRRLAETGQLAGTDLVWKPGLAEWKAAGQVPELASLFRPAAPPPPPAAPPSPAPAPYVPPPPAARPVEPAPYTPPAPAAAPVAPAPYAPPPAAARPADFSPYAPPAAPLTSPPVYPAPMFGATTAVEYASFGLRFAALLVDQILMGCVGGLLGFAIGFALAAGSGGNLSGREWIFNVVGLVIGWLYYAGLESSSQMATLGKRLVGIKVTDLEGRQIDFGRATGRHFGKILSAIPLGLGFFMMLSDPRKQTWHDKMAGCLVVKAR